MEEKLLARLCRKYDDVIRLLRVMGVDENDVEDLAGEIFIDAYEGIDTLRDEEKLTPWLRTIAKNKAAKYFGRRKKRKELYGMVRLETGVEFDLLEAIPDEHTVEKLLQKAEEQAMVEELLDSLPEAGRRIIRMHFWGEYRFTEIAEILNLNVNTVKSIYRRSLKRLKDHYEEVFGKEEDYGRWR